MRIISGIILTIFSFTIALSAQTKPRPRPTPGKIPAGIPVKPGTTPIPKGSTDMGSVSGRTYTNKSLGVEVTFPDTWLIPGDDFEAYMKSQGFDLSLKPDESFGLSAKTDLKNALRYTKILLTAYRSMPGMSDNAIVRIAAEDLIENPHIKDAVDYLDAMRASYRLMKLPSDFKYSDTQAEKLGTKQFGYIDTSTNAGKKRMYVMVRNGFATMFMISYSKDDDLQTLRQVLEQGNFTLK